MNDFKELKCYKWDYLGGDLICIIDGNFGEWFWNLHGCGTVHFIICYELDEDDFRDGNDFITMTERFMTSGPFGAIVNSLKEDYKA